MISRYREPLPVKGEALLGIGRIADGIRIENIHALRRSIKVLEEMIKILISDQIGISQEGKNHKGEQRKIHDHLKNPKPFGYSLIISILDSLHRLLCRTADHPFASPLLHLSSPFSEIRYFRYSTRLR